MAIIAIDFDGTCVTHEYPNIGIDIGAQSVLKDLILNGHMLILFTMRSGKELKKAEKWFSENNIPLMGVQKNPTQKEWTASPKAFANLYIDDAALGCPLLYSEDISTRPFVNWVAVRRMLETSGFLPITNRGMLNNEQTT